MAGIYLHIPFCRQACFYCDFHFSTNLKPIDAMVDAMCYEIELRAGYLNDREIKTIYFGGGTPSLLQAAHLSKLMDAIKSQYAVLEDAEITLEANPDDIESDRLNIWKEAGINRLSIGVQTFDADRLRMLNRAHDREQALQSIPLALSHGFTNVNCDLIYAIPPAAMTIWMKDVELMIDYGIPHLSLYGLTIEEQTVFGRWRTSGRFHEVSEEENADQYQYAIDRLARAGYRHYEVSNFCLPGRESLHNSSYWLQKEYLGIGPGAHSFNTTTRAYAVRNNAKYIAMLSDKKSPVEIDELSLTDRLNEYTLTRIRTAFGIETAYLDSISEGRFTRRNEQVLRQLVKQGMMVGDAAGGYVITTAGMFHADDIAMKLFLES